MVAVLAVLVSIVSGSSGFGQNQLDADSLADVEQQLARALVSGDRATIEGILAPDWSVTDASGRVLSRDQVIQQSLGS